MFGLILPRCLLVLLLYVFGAPLAGQTAPPAKAAATLSQDNVDAPRTPSAKELREAQIAADSEKLYQLAQQLKVEMDKSTKDTLSLSVIKKASEIERLAHSISDRMKAN